MNINNFRQFHYKKEPRNGEGVVVRENGVHGRFVLFNLRELTASLHGYGNNLVEMKN